MYSYVGLVLSSDHPVALKQGFERIAAAGFISAISKQAKAQPAFPTRRITPLYEKSQIDAISLFSWLTGAYFLSKL
jgi:hypothetical protein